MYNFLLFLVSFYSFQLELVVHMKFSDASFAVKKGFPFLPFLNMEITKMRRSGLLYHILERILFKKPFCPSKHNDDDEAPIKIQKAVLPFSIIVLGFISSLIFLAIELINYIIPKQG